MLAWRTGIHALLLILLACGAGVWGALLFEPEPDPLPPAAMVTAKQPSANTAALAQWLSGAAHLRVSVAGLMRSDQQGAALLVVNGAAPRAYRQGEALAPGLTVAEVHADAVVLRRDGVTERLPAPSHTAPAQGLRPPGVRLPARPEP